MLRVRHVLSSTGARGLQRTLLGARNGGAAGSVSSQALRAALLATSSAVLTMTLQEQRDAHCDAAMLVAPQKTIPLPVIDLSLPNKAELEEEVDSLWQRLVNKTKQTYAQLTSAVTYMERVLTYMFFGAPLLGLVPANYLLGERMPELENLTWGYLVWAAQQLGPCFVKMAQWASTRPDLFPPKLIEKIVVLQDDVKVNYPMSLVELTLAEAFGENWKTKLVLEPKPLGAGSVAQVFKGVLKRGKDEMSVAVKMIHPHVERLIRVDMELLTMFADYLDTFPSLEMLSLGDTARQFGESMNQQMDLRKEASHLVKFAKKFAHDDWAVFPKPIDGFVTKNVLVETLMEGTPISNFMILSDDVALKLKRKLSDLGTRLVLKMIFFDNFIHADLHPGNMMVQFTADHEPRLVVLDCGIVYSSKSDAEHEKLVDICLAFMQHDGTKAGRLMIDNTRATSKHVVEHEEDFCRAIQKIVTDSENERYFEHMGEYIGKICDLAREHSVKFDPGYFKIAMALKVAEGMSLSFDPDLDLVSKCIPIVVKARAMRKLGIQKFPAPEPDDEFMKPSADDKANHAKAMAIVNATNRKN